MAKIHPSSEARRPTTPSTPVYAFVDGVTGETRWSTTVPKLVMATDSEMGDLQKSFPHCLSSHDRVRVVNSGELTCMDSYVSNIEELADLAEDVPMLPDDFTEGELLALLSGGDSNRAAEADRAENIAKHWSCVVRLCRWEG